MIESMFVFVIGAIIGSFNNVVIYRLPRGKSVVTPGSQCQSCGKAIYPWDNIPLLSYLVLRGRCRFCSEHISLRYPAIELLTGLLFLFVYMKYNFSILFIIYSILINTFIIVSMIDYDFKIIPNIITIPGIMLCLLINIFVFPYDFHSFLIGALSGVAIFYIIAIISNGGMGGGDIKLIAMIGAFLGWKGVFFTIFSGAMFGSIVGILLILIGKKRRKDKVPFGPFLSFGATLYIFVGNSLINWYLNTLL
jgi:leader peptidase (prepilin peptidase)/N-methyltransferase